MERLRRFDAFWKRAEVERPLFGFHLPTKRTGRISRNGAEMVIPDEVAQEAVEEYLSAQAIDQDALWTAEPPSDISWVELAAATGTETHSWTDLYGKTVAELTAVAFGKFPVGQAELRGATSVLGEVFGKENLSRIVAQNLAAARDIISRTENVQAAYLRLTEETSALEGGHALGGLHLWAPGTCALIRDEEAARFRRDEYERLFLPSIGRLAGTVQFATYGLDYGSLHIVDSILELDAIKCIEFRVDGDTPPLVDFMPMLRRIQDAGRCLAINGAVSKEDLDSILDGLSYSGLYLRIAKGTPTEARFWSAYLLNHHRRKETFLC
jgi:hypothetical protein